MTTLWARLALGDLFIHGIGGAKYDQVTDRLIERFFGIRPPGFLVVSATLRLPVGDCPNFRASENGTVPFSTALDESRIIQRELRSMTYHPEMFLDGVKVDEHLTELVAEKRRWIETPQTIENARQRCQAIRQINAALQPRLADRRSRLIARQAETARRFQAERVLRWREYAFCLCPADELRSFMENTLPARADRSV